MPESRRRAEHPHVPRSALSCRDGVSAGSRAPDRGHLASTDRYGGKYGLLLGAENKRPSLVRQLRAAGSALGAPAATYVGYALSVSPASIRPRLTVVSLIDQERTSGRIHYPHSCQ